MSDIIEDLIKNSKVVVGPAHRFPSRYTSIFNNADVGKQRLMEAYVELLLSQKLADDRISAEEKCVAFMDGE